MQKLKRLQQGIWGSKMRLKKIVKGLLLVVLITATVIGSHIWTITHLEIETDGNGDSAFVSCAGQEWFYGINGHIIDENGMVVDWVND